MYCFHCGYGSKNSMYATSTLFLVFDQVVVFRQYVRKIIAFVAGKQHNQRTTDFQLLQSELKMNNSA